MTRNGDAAEFAFGQFQRCRVTCVIEFPMVVLLRQRFVETGRPAGEVLHAQVAKTGIKARKGPTAVQVYAPDVDAQDVADFGLFHVIGAHLRVGLAKLSIRAGLA